MKQASQILNAILVWISAAVIACGVSFLTSIVGVFCLALLFSDSENATVTMLVPWLLFASVGFAGVFTGTLRLPKESRKLGSMVLLAFGLGFYAWLWNHMYTEAIEPGGNRFPHFPALAIGGFAAVAVFLFRRTGNTPVSPSSNARRTTISAMKRALLFGIGLLWLAFALGFGYFIVQYITQGAGLQFSTPIISNTSITIGLVHLVGLCAAALICFAIGAGLCARAIVRKDIQK